MKASIAVGLILVVFGGALALGWAKFQQFSYCIGLKILGVCLGSVYNYTSEVGVGVLVLGFLVVVLSR